MKKQLKKYLGRRLALDHLGRDERGVVAIMLTVYLPVIAGLFSLAVDMSYVLQTRDMLQVTAESAALAAASSQVISDNGSCVSDPNSVCSIAQQYAAYNMPTAQYGNVLPQANILVGKWSPGCSGSTCFTSSVPVGTACPSCNAVKVTTQMATSNGNALPLFFAQLIGFKSADLTAAAVATSASSTPQPNINFYLLLDNSPSMAIAGTPAGITTMVNNTSAQGGCAFACHETNPSSPDNAGNPGGEDNYQLARNLNVTLRIDLLAQATANLMSTATATEAVNDNTYKMAIYTFNYALNTIYAPSGKPSSNLTAAGAAAANIQVLEVYNQNDLTSSNYNYDTDTNFELAMSGINTIMPNPGGGTNATGDTPQEVLLIVSDGVDDFSSSSMSACSEPVISYSNPTKYRCQQPFSTTWCTTIKNRGIRVAVLYTEYLPLPTNTWYETGSGTFLGIAPFQAQIGTNMRACASPGLFFDVQTGGDITAAMNALFQTAVATAPATLAQ